MENTSEMIPRVWSENRVERLDFVRVEWDPKCNYGTDIFVFFADKIALPIF